jgi:dTDP-glucose pyrophosphorylase
MPVVIIDATLFEAMAVIEAGAKSIAFVVDSSQRVVGTLTDGDVRRSLLAGSSLESRCLERAMRHDFVSVSVDMNRADVLDVMRARQVEQIPIIDERGRLCGLHTIQEMIAPGDRPNPVIILAGGLGARLHPLTLDIPKPMIRVAGRPILERLVLHLMSSGLRRFYFSVNYLADQIERHFGDGSRLGCQISYLHEDVPLGTGGPLSLLPPLEAPLLVCNGDLVTQCDVGRMLDFHANGNYAATCGLRPYSVDVPFGVVTVSGDRVVGLEEKPTHRMLINAGIYVFSTVAVGMVPQSISFPITDLLARLLASGLQVGAHVVQEEWMDVGGHAELRRAQGLSEP